MNEELFVEGAIASSYAGSIIEAASESKDMGAHLIFLGQIREDNADDTKVVAMNYTANKELSNEEHKKIIADLYAEFNITNAHIRHSLGIVNSGEICLFIFLSSKHRSECQLAMDWLIEAVKNRLAIFAKEMMKDGAYKWKENTAKIQ